nr:reverse transcriptase domain-containing protein [Tanacetum cinerariifolium]
SFSKLSRDQTSNPTSSTNPTPKGRIRRSSKQKVENSNFEEQLPPVATMADNRTMAEMLRAPTEVCEEAIVVPSILAEQFELKHSLINMMTLKQFFGLENDNLHDHIRAARRWLEKEPPRSITTWDDLAWERYKDLLRACPHHDFTELHKLDTFYNALNPANQDSLNAAAGGNFLEKSPQDALTIIENKSKVRNSQSKPIASPVNAYDINSSSEIAKLTHAVNHAHPYYQFLAAGGDTFPEFRDNIQGYVSAAAINYNQGNPGYRPQGVANQMRPPGSGSLPGNTVANPKGKLKAITTRSGLETDGPTIPTPPKSITPEVDERVKETYTNPDLAEYTIKVPPPPQQKDEVQIQKFLHMFKQLHLNITLAEALVLMPKYQKMLKALLSNKEKLQKLANTPLNENCSAVILKKLPKKLGDPWKFLIPCGFGLPDLIPTRMTLELANRAICTPDGVARDVFVYVGKFTFPADFVVVDYESDPRVPLILGRPFLRTTRALIDVYGEEMILRKDSGLKDSIDQTDLANLVDYFVDPTPAMFTYELASDYSSPLRFDVYDDDFLEVESDADNFYDDPFDSKGEKIKESKLLIDEPDLLCDFLPYFEYDSFNSQDFSRDDDLPSTDNEDKEISSLLALVQDSIHRQFTGLSQPTHVRRAEYARKGANPARLGHACIRCGPARVLRHELPLAFANHSRKSAPREGAARKAQSGKSSSQCFERLVAYYGVKGLWSLEARRRDTEQKKGPQEKDWVWTGLETRGRVCSRTLTTKGVGHTTVVAVTPKATTIVLAQGKQSLLLKNIITKEHPHKGWKHCQKVKIVQKDTGSQNQSGRSRALRMICPNRGREVVASSHEQNKSLSSWKHQEAGQTQNLKKGGFQNQQRSKRKQDSKKAVTFNQRTEAKQWERPGKGRKKRETLGKDKPLEILMGPMIIKAEMGGHFIHRMYVNGGSSSEILYEHYFNRFCLEARSQMVPTTIPLVGFSGELIWPLGQISLLVKIGPGVSQRVINQVIEENFQVAIHPEYSKQTITIGSTLTKEWQKELCGLLRRNLDIFAWKPSDMNGVPCHIEEHRLNIREGCIPVRKKKRGQALERNNAIYEQVENLVDPGIIKEVHYHSWLSNPIMRDKHEVKSQKYTFGMRKGVFLGYKVNADGLKLCPDKVEAVLSLSSPKCLKGVQKLNGKLASLNIFLFKSAKKLLPFFKTLKKCTKKSDFQWTAEAETAFKQMKKLIAELPMLTAPKVKEELVIYLVTAKEAISAVLMTKRDGKQMPIYFVNRALQGPKINYTLMEKLILTLDDPPDTPMKQKEELPDPFEATNNEAEYEALIAGLRIAEQMGVKKLQANVDSRIVANLNSPSNKYLDERTKKADALSKMASTSFAHISKQVLVEELKEKSIDEKEVLAVVEEKERTWMTPISEYLTEEILPKEKRKARAIRRKAGRYVVTNGILYKRRPRLPDNEASHANDGDKLEPKWEGPYEVTEALGKGAYKLRDRNGSILPLTWNVCNLKKCYVHEM